MGCWWSGFWRRGCGCWPLHPNQVKAARDRFRASGSKSDRFDRFVLCELACTDRHRFRLLEPDCDQTKALGALTRARGSGLCHGGVGQPASRGAWRIATPTARRGHSCFC
ncbi:MAG: transposase, partial [Solirubrobacterales bacterium]|nr:transposase [Solirubrobacterales bacterium]